MNPKVKGIRRRGSQLHAAAKIPPGRRKWKPPLLTAVLLWVFFAAPAHLSASVSAFVSIPPQKHFVEKVGGRHVSVEVMAPPGANPATYEPKPRQMAALAEADAYFAVGVPFEAAWLPRIAASNAALKIVHTDEGVEKIPMDSHRHDHAEIDGDFRKRQGEHASADPHIWTDPNLVKTQAARIRDALVEIDPENKEAYESGYERFVSELDALDAKIRRILQDKTGAAFLVFHPSWGYFARAYGLRQVAIETEGKAPKARRLREIIDYAEKHSIRVIFVQPQFSTRSAEAIADAIGGEVVYADPLAEDWDDNLLRQAEAFASALR